MKVLIACEYSGIVREEFNKLGHAAWSCDLLPTEIAGWHWQMDVERVLNETQRYWDMIIAFPPCTDLAVSGAKWFKEKRKDGRQQKAIDFFMMFANYDCPKIAIENPVGIMSTIWRKPDQIIQPYEFGEPESKKTCLWLKGLPKLIPTNILEKPANGYWSNQTPSGQNKLGPSDNRAKIRSKTYLGIAKAMAEQWST